MLLQYLANEHGVSKQVYINFTKDREPFLNTLCYGLLCVQYD